ncbi:MAG: aldo/keto reductase [Azospirillaceae bacterium]
MERIAKDGTVRRRTLCDQIAATTARGLAFGAGPIGNAHHSLSDADAVATVHAAIARGMTYLDTAPLYGTGHSERRIGLALRDVPRGEVVLSTKVGRRLDPSRPAFGQDAAVRFDYGRDGAYRSLEESLSRLGVDRVDIALIHDIDRWTHGDRQPDVFREALDGAYRALVELRDQGTVAAIGIGLNDSDVALAAIEAMDLDIVLLAGRYTLLDQGAAERFLPAAAVRGVPVVVGGPFNSGILATGARPGALYNYAPAPPPVLDRVSRISAVCARHGVALPAAALQFPLRHPAVSAVVTGFAAPDEVAVAIERMSAIVPEDLWEELATEGLVNEGPGNG